MKAFVSLLLAVGCLLALPGVAGAAAYTVDSTGDAPDNGAPNGVCETVTPGECTLRAAIQESNATAAVKDTILFDLSVFEGQLADTIVPGAALPALTSPVEINAGTCLTAAGINGPCAGINGPGGGIGLEVTADETSISRLSITGVGFGIGVFSASTDFAARGNWIGVKLDGTAGGNGNVGIFIDPNSDDATIGGTEPGQRNVISNTAGVALDLEGASEATIQGNYFGVSLDGATQMSNGTDIEITDRVGATPSEDVAAEENEVGATIEGSALTSTACDGGCNVISGALGAGVDLNGIAIQSEKPATGPTTVHGNFVGLNAAGTAAIANAGVGIWAGGADHVTVGAESIFDPLPPERNYIAGGSEGIVSESGGNDFEARGNSIGFAADGTDVAPPLVNGIFALALSVSEEPSIESNDVRMIGGVGIEVRFLTGRIIGNNLEGGARGIRVGVEPGDGLIASNTIEEPTEFGILVESPDTEVRNNDIFDAGAAGIRVVNPLGGIAVNGSRIGGDTAESENLIEGSGGDAIEILEEAGEPGSTTEIGRNRGSGNAGQFIDLVAGANEGIVSPAFSSATQSKAEGTTAEPGATVRVFRKASAEAGELQSFLAEAVADGSGKWSVTYPQVPTGTIAAATQTGETGGTSELATTTAAADPSKGGGATGGDGGKDGKVPGDKCKPTKPKKCPGDQVDPAPQTRIDKGPKGKVATRAVKFKFSSNEKGSTFRCKLDRRPYRVCKSPKTYKNLKLGKHVFKVRAVDKAGNIDPSAAKRKFTILG